MDEFKKVIQQMDNGTYKNLKRAVELGKWPDGRVLTQQQRETSMQAVIAYELEHNVVADQRTGFVDTSSSDCHDDEGNHVGSGDTSQPLKWQ